MKLGIQLYTVRDPCNADFAGAVKALAEMGYDGVEFAGNYGNMEPSALAGFLRELGLVTAGQHVSLDDIIDSGSDTYRYAKALGCPYVTTSLAGSVEKEWKAIVPRCIEAAATAASKGCVFTYHNHAQEFTRIDGITAEDMLFNAPGAHRPQFELDIYWIRKSGEDPLDYIRRYRGRVPQVHLKDMNPADGSFTEVGRGLMDLPAIFDAAKEAGAEWIIVEQDICKRPALESARMSCEAALPFLRAKSARTPESSKKTAKRGNKRNM